MGVRLLVGTAKGGFRVTSDDRREWKVEGPFFKGWKVTAGLRLRDGGFVAAVASEIYGPAIFLSPDGEEWEQVENGPAYPDGDDRRLRQIWTLRENRGTLYAGVQDAGVFTSGDGGRYWRPVPGLNEHETRAGWMPGAGGSAAMPSCSITRTLTACGAGYRPWASSAPTTAAPRGFRRTGACTGRTRTRNSRRSGTACTVWPRIRMIRGGSTAGSFGDVPEPGRRGIMGKERKRACDIVRIPERPGPGQPVSLCGAARSGSIPVARRGGAQGGSEHGRGDSWHSASEGLPAKHAYGGVLRGAMAVDNLRPGGVYMGTTSGTLHASRDLGESWTNLPVTLPRILHVSAWVG